MCGNASVSDLIDGVDDAAVAVAHDGDWFVGKADFFRFAGQRDGAFVQGFDGGQFNSGIAQAFGQLRATRVDGHAVVGDEQLRDRKSVV